MDGPGSRSDQCDRQQVFVTTLVPTLYEWTRGEPALYAREPQDPLLGPVSAQIPAEHAEQQA